jgi:hypothetical protein
MLHGHGVYDFGCNPPSLAIIKMKSLFLQNGPGCSQGEGFIACDRFDLMDNVFDPRHNFFELSYHPRFRFDIEDFDVKIDSITLKEYGNFSLKTGFKLLTGLAILFSSLSN